VAQAYLAKTALPASASAANTVGAASSAVTASRRTERVTDMNDFLQAEGAATAGFDWPRFYQRRPGTPPEEVCRQPSMPPLRSGSSPSDRIVTGLGGDADPAQVGKFGDARLAAETAQARGLGAAEGHLRLVLHGGAVDVTDSRFDALCHREGAA